MKYLLSPTVEWTDMIPVATKTSFKLYFVRILLTVPLFALWTSQFIIHWRARSWLELTNAAVISQSLPGTTLLFVTVMLGCSLGATLAIFQASEKAQTQLNQNFDFVDGEDKHVHFGDPFKGLVGAILALQFSAAVGLLVQNWFMGRVFKMWFGNEIEAVRAAENKG